MGLSGLFFWSGALALIYEVIWQRQFALLFGSAGPATAAVLAAYFTGLGAGSFALGAAAKRWTRPLRAYALLEVLIGGGALLVPTLLNGIESIYPWLFARFDHTPGLFFAVRLLLAFVSIALPTFCMGGTLPLLGQLVDRGPRRLGLNAGLLYAANTAGAALGALSVPFVLLPAMGARGTLWLCVVGNTLVGLTAWWMDRRWPSENAQPVKTAQTPDIESKPSRSKSLLGLSFISGLAAFAL